MPTTDVLSALQPETSASDALVFAPVQRDLISINTDLQSIIVPVVLAYGGVGFRDVQQPDAKLLVTIAPNVLFEIGDVFRVFWGTDQFAAAVHTMAQQDRNLPITLEIDVTLIQRIGDGLIPVWFTLTSAFTGDVQRSPDALVRVKMTLPGGRDPNPVDTPYTNENLAAPTIPPGIIGVPEAEAGVPVTVPPWLNMAVGDRLRIRWGIESVRHPPLTQAEVGKPVTVVIDKNTILAGGDSENLMVTYDIDDVVSEWSYNSPASFVNVEASGATLAVPYILQAPSGDLDYAALSGRDADVVVVYLSPPMAIGDTVLVVFEGLSGDGVTVRHEMTARVTAAGALITTKLPNAVVRTVTPGTASVYYFVRNGTTEKGRSRRLSLRVLGERGGLAAPRVREATANRQLDPINTPNGANVEIDPYAGMSEGDLVSLRWEGTRANGTPMVYTSCKTLTAADLQRRVDFLVPPLYVDTLLGGTVNVFYTVTPSSGDRLTRVSDVLALNVVGANLLRRPEVAGVTNGQLTPPANPSQGVELSVLPYTLMSAGDVIEWFWDGPTAAGTTRGRVVVTDPSRAVTVTVPRSVVDANSAGLASVDAHYRVTRAGQATPQESSINRFTVLAAPQPGLPPPLVDEAPMGVLDPEALTGSFVTVRVKPYPGMRNGDRVTVRWGEGTGGGEQIRTIDITTNIENLDITMRVDRSRVDFFQDSSVIVNYTVNRLDGTRQDSEDFTVVVRTERRWPAPRVVDAVGDFLDPALAALGAETIVLRYADMMRGDRLIMHWGNPGDVGFYTDSITVSTVRDYHFLLNAATVAPWINRTVPVWYEVQRGGVVRFRSEVLQLRIGMNEQPALPAPSVPEADGTVLDPSKLTTSATATIPAYPGMASGDFIVMTWGGGPGSGGLEWEIDVSAAMVGRPITRPIPIANITPFEGRDVTLQYSVDGVRPPRRVSDPLTLTVRRQSLQIGAPRVPSVQNGVLDPREVLQGAQVLVDFSNVMRQGDTIRLHWENSIAAGSDERSATVGSTQNPISFTIGADKVQAGTGGNVSVWYEVVRLNAVIATSARLEFVVRRSALPLPVIVQAIGQVLDPTAVPATGATVRLAATGIFRANDRIELRVVGAAGAGSGTFSHVVLASQEGSHIDIVVPKSVIDANNGGAPMTLSYSVTRQGSTLVENSGPNVYDVRRELGVGDLRVVGARNNGTSYRSSSMPQYLRALDRTTRNDMLAEWRYSDEQAWTSAVSFKDTRPWMPLRVRSSTNQVTINPVNLFGNGSDSVTASGVAALSAIFARRNIDAWGADAHGGVVRPTTYLTLDDIVEVSATRSAFAIRRAGGQIAAWGNSAEGGASTLFASVNDAVRIHGNSRAFVVVRGQGYLSAWGTAAAGATLSTAASNLRDVRSVAVAGNAFCALTSRRTVVAWGEQANGGNPSLAITGLNDIIDVRGNFTAFCALRANGSVVAWGAGVNDGRQIAGRFDIVELASATARAFAVRTRAGGVLAFGLGAYGGTPDTSVTNLTNVEEVTATWGAFAARLSNGAVVCWGDVNRGANVPEAIARRRDIVHVASTAGAFAALTRSGTVVAWGNTSQGGNAAPVAGQLTDIVALYSSTEAFCAFRATGGVVTWGVANGGATIPAAIRANLDTNFFYQATAGGLSLATPQGKAAMAATV